MENIIFELPNDEYHNGDGYSDYISSSKLKTYAKSPRLAHLQMTDPAYAIEQTDAMRRGSLVHSAFEFIVNGGTLYDYLQTLACFEAPVNPRTGTPYGSQTKAYQESYQAWITQDGVAGKTIINESDRDLISSTVTSALANEYVRKFIRYGKPDSSRIVGPEISFFLDMVTPGGNPLKMKCRPDLLTSNKCIDFKTTSLETFNNDNLAKAIVDFDYGVSAAMYQFILWKITGKFYAFYWVFISTKAPNEVAVVGSSKIAFSCVEDLEMFDRTLFESDDYVFNPGVMKFRDILLTHVKCTDKNEWPGSECYIEPDDNGIRIFEPEIPAWESRKSYKSYI